MVVAEIALAVVLLIGAGLLIRSFARVLDEELGFEPNGVVAANVFLADTRYPDEHLQVAFFDEVLEGIRSVPGVVAAGATLALPLNAVSIDFDLPFDIDGQAPHEPGREPQADYRVITPDYLAVMRIPLLRGRVFDSRDREGAPNVMLINQTMASRYFRGEDPVGVRVRIPIGGWHEVVGVIGDVRDRGLDSEPRAEIYVPFHEHPFSGMVIAARTDGSTSSLAQAITSEVFAVDPDQSITRLATMNELISESVARRRFNMTLLGGFAALALVLAAIGIYGVISYGVSQRTREIGVRLAMGAQQNDVVRMVLADGLKLATAGVGIGVFGAFALTRVMASLLYEVSPADPATFVGVPVLLALAAVAASYVPALRATRVDPVLALRHE
jgi:putative ABC transport system permease protein